MKRVKKLIILIIVLAVFVGIYFAATLIKKNSETDEGGEEDTSFLVYDLSDKTISTVEYTKGEDTVVINVSGTSYKLGLDEDFPLNQNVAQYMINAATSATATGSIDGTGTLEEYGLDEPEYKLSVTLSNGDKTVLYIGDYNKYSDVYYGMLEGSNTVYFFDDQITNYYGLSLDDLIVNEEITVPTNGISTVSRIDVEKADGTKVYYIFVEGSAEEKDDDGNVTKEAVDDTWECHAEDGTLISSGMTEKAEGIYSNVFDSELTDWIEYKSDDEVKANYGLNPAEYKVTFTYTETVTSSASDETSSTSVDVEKTVSFLVGSVLPTEETEENEETAETDAETEAETNAETEANEDTEATDDTDTEEEENTASRYVMIDGGKIIYVLPETSVSYILD